MAEVGDYDVDVDERTKLIDPNKPDDDDDNYMLEMKERNKRINDDDREKKRLERRKNPATGGARPKTSTSTQSYDNPSYVVNDSLTTDEKLAVKADLDKREEDQTTAWSMIRAKFPEFKPDTSKFIAIIDGNGDVQVRLVRKGAIWHNFLDSNGELNTDLPPTFKKNLGLPVETVIEKAVNKIQRLRDKIREDKAQLDRVGISEADTIELTEGINTSVKAIADGEEEIATLEGRMKLTDRIKSYFNRYGFTIVSVALAVGAIIGVIISNLKTGLAKMAKGVGNGLKEIGKKLAAILPGMIGAIASFIFKTAGEVVGFLAKNAWLLIIAVAIVVIDQFKKKNR